MNLVTGAKGFIGTRLMAAIDARGIDRGDTPPLNVGYDTVFHLAARVGSEDSQERLVAYCRDNVMYTARLLEMLTRRPPQHMVLASSCVAMHGGTPYAATKAMQEELCACWCERNGVTLSILRLHAVYGPGQGDNGTYEGVVAKFAHALTRGEAPVVDDDGMQVRDFVHVDDVVAASRMAATERFDGITEIGTGRPTAILDVATKLRELVGGPEPVVTGTRRQGDVRSIVADLTGTERFGWAPTISLDDGLASYAKSLRVASCAS